MLKPVEDGPAIVACNTCRHGADAREDKVGYVLGRFTPDKEAATAILDHAVHYAESKHGEVPFKQWPQGVKRHFITRTPSPGYVAE